MPIESRILLWGQGPFWGRWKLTQRDRRTSEQLLFKAESTWTIIRSEHSRGQGPSSATSTKKTSGLFLTLPRQFHAQAIFHYDQIETQSDSSEQSVSLLCHLGVVFEDRSKHENLLWRARSSSNNQKQPAWSCRWAAGRERGRLHVHI